MTPVQNAVTLITIGDELLIGQTIDTNSAFIARMLNANGLWVQRRVALGDNRDMILQTLEEESKKSKIIIITGGLGPTSDDITKPALCAYFNTGLVLNHGVLKNIEAIFKKLRRPLTEPNKKQAEVPECCTVLPNPRGTAPGMWFEKDGVVYISLPGVPYEMEGLMEAEVLPRLMQTFSKAHIVHQNLVTYGKGESEVAAMLTDFEQQLPEDISLAYLPNHGMVKLRLTGKSETNENIADEVSTQMQQLRTIMQQYVVGEGDITMADAVSDLLKKTNQTLSTAESCTGGLIAHLLTEKSGASALYVGGVVSYTNKVKERLLDVQHHTLEHYNAVSEETVREMAIGVLQKTGSDYALATTGFMGPDGGEEGIPVGTLWIAVADKHAVKSTRHHVRFNRKKNIEVAAQFALNQLRLFMQGEAKTTS